MSGRHSAALKEVLDLYEKREEHYGALLKKTQAGLVAFKERLEFRDAIYRVYSRADKQTGGAPLKDADKTAKKLVELRKKLPALSHRRYMTSLESQSSYTMNPSATS